MLQHRCSVLVLVVGGALTAAALGWLDRVVRLQREKFLGELQDLAPVKVKAELRPKPPGYEDTGDWDYDSVLRLLTSIRGSATGKSLRRMLAPTRRYKMGMKESIRWFPSITKDHIYYDVDYSSSEDSHSPADANHHMITITNPVASKMPSASISIERLKRILEEKAERLREMPIVHVEMPNITAKATTPKSTNTTADVSSGNTTERQDSNGTFAPGGGDTTIAPAAGGDNSTGSGGGAETTVADGTVPVETTAAAES